MNKLGPAIAVVAAELMSGCTPGCAPLPVPVPVPGRLEQPIEMEESLKIAAEVIALTATLKRPAKCDSVLQAVVNVLNQNHATQLNETIFKITETVLLQIYKLETGETIKEVHVRIAKTGDDIGFQGAIVIPCKDPVQGTIVNAGDTEED